MRLIDADALRERMYHDAFEMDSDMQKWDGGCWIRYKMFESAIDDAPTIEPQQWIPVTERLPYKDGIYLVTDKRGEIYVASYGYEFIEDEDVEWWSGGCRLCVTAWMPLPKPWKGGDSDGT